MSDVSQEQKRRSRRPPPTPKALAMVATIRQWQAEDAAEQTDDEEELARRDRERAELEANLDAPRRKAGMRLLFPKSESERT